MIELGTHPEGIVLPIRAMPGASAARIRGEHNGALKVAVTQVAEKGKANQALVEVLAKALGVKRSQVDLLSGETDRDKRFLVRDVKLEWLRERIGEMLARKD
jgi:uncharacterized protein (TIGR00251 family)